MIEALKERPWRPVVAGWLAFNRFPTGSRYPLPNRGLAENTLHREGELATPEGAGSGCC